MYSKTAKRKLSTLAKPGALVLLPAKSDASQSPLAAACDGCGAEIWIPRDFKEMLEEGNHRTFCLQCLQLRQVV